MTSWFPLPIELVHLLHVLSPNQLRNELKLLPELQYALFKYSHLPWRPSLKHRTRSHRVYQNIQVPLLIKMIHSVQVQLHRLLLFLRIRLKHVALSMNNLQNRLLVGSYSLKQRHIRMIITTLTTSNQILINLLKIKTALGTSLLSLYLFVRFRHIKLLLSIPIKW